MSRRHRNRAEPTEARTEAEARRVLDLLDELDDEPKRRRVSVAEHQDWLAAGRPPHRELNREEETR